MSISATGDLLVHLGRVQNLDCFGCGIYQIRVELLTSTRPEAGAKERVQRVPPSFIPPKPFLEHRAPLFLEAYIDELRGIYVSQTFPLRGHTDEVELNDLVLFRFFRQPDERDWCRYLRFSFWRKDGAGEFLMLATKVFAVRSLGGSFAQPLPVFFEAQRVCVLYAGLKAVTLAFEMRPGAESARGFAEATEGFAPLLVDRLYLLLSRRLFAGIRLVCAQISALVAHYQHGPEDLFADLVAEAYPFQQGAARRQLAEVERRNRLVRDKLLADALVG